MKKLLVALLSVVTCASLFAFAACGDGTDEDKTNGNGGNGGNGNGGNTTTTNVAMTESEWTEYWENLAESESYTLKISQKMSAGGQEQTSGYTDKYDGKNYVYHSNSDDDDEDYEYYTFANTEELTVYHVSNYGDGWEVGYTDDSFETEAELKAEFESENMLTEMCGDIKEWYGDLTYSTETGVYSGTIEMEGQEAEIEITTGSTVSINMSAEISYGDVSASVEISYEITDINSTVVTVPQEVQDAIENYSDNYTDDGSVAGNTYAYVTARLKDFSANVAEEDAQDTINNFNSYKDTAYAGFRISFDTDGSVVLTYGEEFHQDPQSGTYVQNGAEISMEINVEVEDNSLYAVIDGNILIIEQEVNVIEEYSKVVYSYTIEITLELQA